MTLRQRNNKLAIWFHVESFAEFDERSQEAVHEAHHQKDDEVDSGNTNEEQSFSGFAVVKLPEPG